VVLTWLKLLHPSLPRLVKQRYGTELRSRTLASIKPEASQALTSLLEEIRASNVAKILRTAVGNEYHHSPPSSKGPVKPGPRNTPCTRMYVKGVRVHMCTAMGMPGSETLEALEEIMRPG